MIDLVSKRYMYLLVSLLIILPGTIAILLGGLKPGIDFTGGTRWEVKPLAARESDTEAFRNALSDLGHGGSLVKGGILTRNDVITNTVIMDIPGQITTEEKARIENEMTDPGRQGGALVAGRLITETQTITGTAGITGTVTPELTSTAGITVTGTTTGTTGAAGATGGAGAGTKTVVRRSILPDDEIDYRTVGPTVGQELIGRAFLAILAASAAILVYLTLVFRKVPNAFRYGVCAIVALLHDVLVVVGVFAILGFAFGVEVDALFITAMLTVIGFSVHDTIVVFDRVRENILKRRFERFADVVNYSLVQTLARSINTSITVLLTLFALYLFGGSSIRNFVLALLIGILSGTYSSIFNASMLLVVWENREWARGRVAQT